MMLLVSSAIAADDQPRRGGPVYEAIVLDAATGQVLRELEPDAVTYPAQLTMMMTLYLTFEALAQGRLRPDQNLSVSHDASIKMPPNLGLTSGQQVTVRDLILGVVIRSANDAATVLAEGLGVTEANFAAMMTRKARQLGTSRTQYRNATGVPDSEQLTTARDTARLALALLHDFPREYRYFSLREFAFRGKIVRSGDHFLERDKGTDGIKSGYTVTSGFNLATSAVRNGRRLVGVIMGSESASDCDAQMGRLLDLGFADLAAPSAATNNNKEIPSKSVRLRLENGIYMVPVRINEQMTVPFILDSGASEVAIPADIFSTLIRTGTVKGEDFLGSGTYVMADGSRQSSERFLLHELKVGDILVKDVIANVVPMKGDPLLGQTFLSKLPAWTIDNKEHNLVFSQ
jgi:D-alanyl-D-alanine carboxypeptidase